MNLYQLTGSYLQVLEMADQFDEEVLNDTLHSINESIEQKAENTAKLIKSIEAEAAAIDAEVKRLNELKKVKQNKAKNIKEYLQSEMLKLEKRKIQTPLFNIRIQKNPPSLSVMDEANIPKRFYEEQAPKLKRRELLNALKDGEELEGVEIKQTEGLRIG